MKIEKEVREILRKHGNYCFEMGRKDELSSDEAVTAILRLVKEENGKAIIRATAFLKKQGYLKNLQNT